MKDSYYRSMSMLCSTCGGAEFEYENDDGPFWCTSCDRIYATRDDLIGENGARIDNQVEEIGQQVVKDFHDDLRKAFKKLR